MEFVPYYFAYGSNMNPEKMLERGVPFRWKKTAVLEGFKLEFNKLCHHYRGNYGCANIEPAEEKVVEVVLYLLENPYEGLINLDYFEGYPEHYTRRVLNVITPEGETFKA
jgi:gamma-glutamylcyclotransferase (GGCT)/AIG2-like uncharacterized protein YtfP